MVTMESTDWKDIKLNVIMLPVSFGLLIAVSCLAICCYKHRSYRIKQQAKQVRRERIRAAQAKRRDQIASFCAVQIQDSSRPTSSRQHKKQKRKKKHSSTNSHTELTNGHSELPNDHNEQPNGIGKLYEAGLNLAQSKNSADWEVRRKSKSVEMTIWNDNPQSTSDSEHQSNGDDDTVLFLQSGNNMEMPMGSPSIKPQLPPIPKTVISPPEASDEFS